MYICSTPIITAPLDNATCIDAARIVKGRIEKTKLGEISEYIEEVFLPQDCYIFVKLHMPRIKMLKLEITAHSVMKSIIAGSKVKLTSSDVRIYNSTSIAVSVRVQCVLAVNNVSLSRLLSFHSLHYFCYNLQSRTVQIVAVIKTIISANILCAYTGHCQY